MIRLVQPQRRSGESVVPMINVAFLLLIFFLMVAVIAPPDPVAVTLPYATTGQDLSDDADLVLVIAVDGTVMRQNGEAASLSDLAGRSVVLRADARVDAGRIAAIIAEVSAGGARSVQLAVATD